MYFNHLNFLNLDADNILYSHRWYIWQKSACRVYYNYLRQVLDGRVRSDVNILKMRMVVIFSLDSKARLRKACMHVYLSSTCLI